VFRLPEGKKIYPEHNFDKTNMAKGEKLPLEDPQVLYSSTFIILHRATQTHSRGLCSSYSFTREQNPQTKTEV